MDWASSAWKEGLPAVALQKVQNLEQQVQWLQKDKQQKAIQIDNLEQVIQKQKLKLEEKQSENVMINRDLQKLEEQCKEYEDKILKIQNKIQLKDSKINSLGGHIEQIKSNSNVVSQFETDIASYKSELESAHQLNEKLETALKDQKKTNLDLQLQLTAFKLKQNVEETLNQDDNFGSSEVFDLQEKIREQEHIIEELRKQLNEKSTENAVTSRSSLIPAPSDSPSDLFWGRFESQSSDDPRRMLNKRDSLLVTPQKSSGARVVLLEQRLKEVNRDLECLRVNAENAKIQMEHKFKDKESELKAEIKDQAQIIADLDNELKDTKAKLQQDITHSSKDLDMMKAKLDKAENLKLQLEEDIKHLNQQIQDLSNLLKSKDEEIADLTKNKKHTEAELISLQSKHTTLNSGSNLNQEVSQITSEPEEEWHEVKEDFDDQEVLLKEKVMFLQQEISTAKNSIMEKNDELDAVKDELATLRKEYEEKSMLLNEIEQKVSHLEQEKQVLQKKCSDLDENMIKVDELLSTKTSELILLENSTSELKREIEANMQLKIENSELKTQLKECKEKLQKIKEKVLDLDLALEVKNNELELSRKEIATLKTTAGEQVQQLNEMEQKLKQVEIEKQSIQEQYLNLEQSNAQTIGVLNSMENELQTLQEEMSTIKLDSEAKTLKLNEMEQKLQELEDAKQSFQEKCNALEQNTAQTEEFLSEKDNELSMLQNEISSLQAVYEIKTSLLQEMEQKMHNLEKKKKKLTEKCCKFEQNLAEINELLRVKNQDESFLRNEVHALKTASEIQETKYNEVERKLQEVEDEKLLLQEQYYNRLEQSDTQATESIAMKDEELSTLRNEISILKTEHDTKTSAISKLELESDELQKENCHLETSIKLLKQEISDKNFDLESTKRELSYLRKDYDDKLLLLGEKEQKIRCMDVVIERSKNLEGNLAEFKQLFIDKDNQVVKFIEEIFHHELENSTLKSTISKLELECDEFAKENCSLETSIELLKQEISEKNFDLESTKRELSYLKKDYEEKLLIVSELKIQSDKLQEEKFSLGENITLLKQEVSARNDDLESTAKELSRWKAAYEEKLLANEQLMEFDRELNCQLNNLKDQLQILQLQLVEKEETASGLNKEVESLKSTLDIQFKNIKELTSNYEDVLKQNEARKEKIGILCKQLSLADSDGFSKAEALDTIASQLETAQSDLTKERLKIDELNQQKQGLENELQALKEEMHHMIAENTKKMEVLSITEKEFLNLKVSFEEKVKELKQFELENEKLVSEVNSLCQNLEEKNANIEMELLAKCAAESKVIELEESNKVLQEKLESTLEKMRHLEENFDNKEIELKDAVTSSEQLGEANKSLLDLISKLEETKTHLERVLNEKESHLQESEINLRKVIYNLKEQRENMQSMEKNAAKWKLKASLLEMELRKTHSSFELCEQEIENLTNQTRCTMEQLEEQRKLNLKLENQLLEKEMMVDQFVCGIVNIKQLTLLCLSYFEYDTPEMQLSSGELIESVKSMLKTLCTLVTQASKDKGTAEHSVSEKENHCQRLLSIIQRYDKSLEENNAQYKNLRNEFDSQKLSNENLTKILEKQEIYCKDQENFILRLKTDIDISVLEIKKISMKLLKLKKQLKKSSVYARKSVDKIIKQRRNICQLRKRERKLKSALNEQKGKFLKINNFCANVLKMLNEKLNFSNSWSNEHLLTYSLSCFPDFFVQIVKENTPKQTSGCSSLVPVHFNNLTMQNKNTFSSICYCEKKILENVFSLSVGIENIISKVKEDMQFKIEAGNWKSQCEFYLSELYLQKKVIQDHKDINSKLVDEFEKLTCEFEQLQKDRNSMEEIMKYHKENHVEDVEKLMHKLKVKEQDCIDMKKTIDEVKENLKKANAENKELYKQVSHVNEELQSLQSVFNENMETYYTPEQYKLLEAKMETFLKDTEDLKLKNFKIMNQIELIETNLNEILHNFPSYEFEFSSLMETPSLFEKLFQTVVRKDDQINTLKESNDEIKGKLNLQANILEENIATCGNLQKDLNEAKSQLQSSHEKVEEMKSINETLNSTVAEVKETLAATLHHEQQIKHNLNTILANYISKLNVPFEKLDDLPLLIHTLYEEMVQQQNKVTENIFIIDSKSKEISDFENLVKELTEKFDNESKLLLEKNQENETLSSRLTELENQLKICHEQLNEKHTDIENYAKKCKDLEKNIKDLLSEVTSLQNANSTLNLNIDGLKEQYQNVFSEKEQFKHQLANILTDFISSDGIENTKLENLLDIIQKVSIEHKKLTNENSEAEKTITEQSSKIVEFEKIVNELSDESALLLEKIKENEVLQMKLTEFEAQAQKYHACLKDNETEMTELKSKYDTLIENASTLQEKVEILQADNSILNVNNDEMQENHQKVLQEQEQLKNELIDMFKAHIPVAEECPLFDLPNIAKNLCSYLLKLKNDLNEALANIEGQNKEITKLTNNIKELEENIATESSLLANKIKENESLQEDIRKVEIQIQEHLENLEAKSEEISNWEVKQEESIKLINTLKEEIATLQRENAKLSSTIAKLEKCCDDNVFEKQQFKNEFDTILADYASRHELSFSFEEIPQIVQNLYEELTKMNEEKENILQLKIKEISELRGEINDASTKLREVNLQKEEKVQECEILNTKISEIELKLQSSMDSSEAKQTEILNVTSKCKDANKLALDLQEQIASLHSENSTLKSNIAELEESYHIVNEGKQQLKTKLGEILDDYVIINDLSFSSLEHVIPIVETLYDKYKEQDIKIEELKNSLNVKLNEISEFQQIIDDLNEKVNKETSLLSQKTQECEVLSKKLDETAHDFQNSIKTLENKEAAIIDLTSKCDDFDKQVMDLKEQEMSLQSINSTLNSKFKEENNSQLHQEQEHFKEKLAEMMRDHFSNDEISCASLPDLLIFVQKICHKSMEQKTEIDKAKTTADIQKKQISDLEQSIIQLSEDANSESNLLSNKIQECEVLQTKLKKLDEQIHFLESANLSLNEEVKDLKNYRDVTLQEGSLLKEMVSSVINFTSDLELDNMPNLVQRLCDNLQENATKSCEYVTVIDNQTKMIIDYEDSIKKLTKEINEKSSILVENSQELEVLNSELIESRSQLKNFKKLIEDKNGEISNWENRYATLSKNLSEVKQQLLSLESASETLNFNSKDYKEKYQKLKEEIMKIFANDTVQDIADVEGLIILINKELKQKKTNIDEANTIINTQNNEIGELKKSMVKVNEKLNNNTSLMVQKQNECQELQAKVFELEEQVESFSGNLMDKDDELVQWETKYEICEKSLDEARALLSCLELEKASLNSALEETKINLQRTFSNERQLRENIANILVLHVLVEKKNIISNIPAILEKLCGEFAQQKIKINENELNNDSKTEELLKLEETVKELTEKIIAEENLLNDEKRMTEELRIKLSESDKQLESYCKDFNNKEIEISEWKSKYEVCNENLDNEQQQLISCERKVMELERSIRDFTEKLSNEENNVKTKNQEIDNLKIKLSNWKSKCESLSDLQKQVSVLEVENSSLISTIDEVEENLQKTFKEKQQLTKHLKNIMTELMSNFEINCQSFEEIPLNLQKLFDENRQMKCELNECRQSINLKNGEKLIFENSIKNLTDEINVQKNLMKEKIEENEQLMVKCENVECQMKQYLIDLKDKDSAIMNWKCKFNEEIKVSEKLRQQVTSLESVNTMLNSTIDEVEENLQKEFLEKQQLKEELSKILEKQNLKCDSFEMIFASIQKLCKEITSQKSELQEKIITIESISKKIDVKDTEILSLENKLQGLNSKATADANKLIEKNQENELLKFKLKSCENQVEIHCNDLQRKEEMISSLKLKYQDSERDVRELSAKLDSMNSKNISLISTIDDLESTIERLWQEKQDHESKLNKITVEYSTKLECENNLLKPELEKCNKLVSILQEKTELSNSCLTNAEKEISNLFQKVLQYQEVVNKLKTNNLTKANLIAKQQLIIKEKITKEENQKKSYEKLRLLNNEANKTNKDLKNAILILDKEKIDLIKRNQQLTVDVQNLQQLTSLVSTLQKDVLNWKTKFDDLVASSENDKPMKINAASNTELEGKVQEYCERISELKKEASVHERENISLKSKVSVLHENFNKTKEKEMQLLEKIKNLEREKCNDCNLTLLKKSHELENLSSHIKELENEKEKLQSQQNQFQEGYGKLNEELTKSKLELQSQRKDVGILKLENSNLVSENESLRSIISHLKAYKDIIKDDPANNQTIETSENLAQSLREKIYLFVIKNFNQTKQMIKGTKSLLLGFNEIVTRILNLILFTERNGHESPLEDMSNVDQEREQQFFSELESLFVVTENLSSLIPSNSFATSEEIRIPDNEEEFQKEIEEINQILFASFKVYQNSLSSVTKCLQSCKKISENSNKQLKQELQRLRLSIRDTNAKIVDLEEEIKKQASENRRVEGKCTVLKNNSYRLEKQNINLEKQIAELQGKTRNEGNMPTSSENLSNHQELEEKIKSLTEEVQELISKLANAEDEQFNAMQGQVEALEKYEKARHENDFLKSHVKRLQNKLKNLNTELHDTNSRVTETPLKEDTLEVVARSSRPMREIPQNDKGGSAQPNR